MNDSPPCDVCGAAMYALHCKLICRNCGFRLGEEVGRHSRGCETLGARPTSATGRYRRYRRDRSDPHHEAPTPIDGTEVAR